MLIQLIALDLDGTTLDDSRQLVATNVEAIRQASSKGVHIALASGRNQASLANFAGELDVPCHLVCSNGAHVLDRVGFEVRHVGIDATARDAIVEYALEAEIQINAYHRHELHLVNHTPWAEIYLQRVGKVVPTDAGATAVRQFDPTKLLLIDDPEKIKGHREALSWIESSGLARATLSEPEYLEYLAIDADKGFGLESLAMHLGLGRESVAAIGDYYNDLEMVMYAGFSGAVSNAVIEVRDAADVVVKDNVSGGVAEFIHLALMHQA